MIERSRGGNYECNRQGVTIQPNNAKVHIAIAQFLMRHDNEKAAFHYLVEANRIDPKNEWVNQQLAAHESLSRAPARVAAKSDRGRGGGGWRSRGSAAPSGRINLFPRTPRVPSGRAGLHPWLQSGAPLGRTVAPPKVSRTR